MSFKYMSIGALSGAALGSLKSGVDNSQGKDSNFIVNTATGTVVGAGLGLGIGKLYRTKTPQYVNSGAKVSSSIEKPINILAPVKTNSTEASTMITDKVRSTYPEYKNLSQIRKYLADPNHVWEF